MTDKVKVLPTESTVYFAVNGGEVRAAMNGELDSWFCHDSLEHAEEAARGHGVEMTILEVKIRPVSITRKVTEVERL